MASPQSITPKPAPASRPRHRFTLDQANQSLPLVRRIVADIVRTHEEISHLQQQLELAKHSQQAGIQERLQLSLGHLQDYMDELTEIGCDLKDYRLGLIDFIGRHHGRDICLCWKLGEPSVEYWHEINTGFAGRQPVSMLREKD